MIVMGIHGGFTNRQHGASATLAIDGQITALCEEERFTRIKDSYGLVPVYSVEACLKIAGIRWEDIDLIVCTGSTYDHHRERLSDFYGRKFGSMPRVELVHHQLAHVASAFYARGADSAVCLALDGTGDECSGLVALADRKSGLRKVREIEDARSLGFFYTAITYYLGFIEGDEYKVMGLAPYGQPSVDLYKFYRPAESGGWMVDTPILKNGPKLISPFEPTYSDQLEEILGRPGRRQSEEISQFHRDVAASIQKVTEECLLSLTNQLKDEFPDESLLCFAGGVALNCVANNRIIAAGHFDELYIPPIAPDRGLSLGCAYLGSGMLGDTPQPITDAYLGPDYDMDAILHEVRHNGLSFEIVDDPAETTAGLLSQGRIVGFFQGRSEAGARALGNRSILALPGGAEMRDKVNRGIKYREEFRPFAPAVLADEASAYFDMMGTLSPYMCVTYDAKSEMHDRLGAVVHVDGTSRVQTVSEAQNPIFSRLLSCLGRETGLPVALNTSFNLKGQPIVETPRDAIMTFFGCGLDDLVLGNVLITKPEKPDQ